MDEKILGDLTLSMNKVRLLCMGFSNFVIVYFKNQKANPECMDPVYYQVEDVCIIQQYRHILWQYIFQSFPCQILSWAGYSPSTHNNYVTGFNDFFLCLQQRCYLPLILVWHGYEAQNTEKSAGHANLHADWRI